MTAPKTVLPGNYTGWYQTYFITLLGDEIMELLSHEEYSNVTKETTSSSSSDNDSTSDEDDELQQANRGYHQQPPQDIAIVSPSIPLTIKSNALACAQDEAGSTISSNGEEDSEDDEMTIRVTIHYHYSLITPNTVLQVGDKVYELNEITQDIINTMTPEEKDKYTELCQQAYNNFY